MKYLSQFHATTILGVQHQNRTALGGDGQVTQGEMVIKANARKVRKLADYDILAGFAGTAADAMTLFDKFEARMEQYHGKMERAIVELAKEWRTDKYLRHLMAQLAVLDRNRLFIISGTGDIIEPDDHIVAIGSGAGYAKAAAQALVKYSNLSAAEIVTEALKITAAICIYTNEQITVLEL